MRRDRLQNHISGSVFTLPVCAVVAVLLWWFPLAQDADSVSSSFERSHLIALGIVALTTYALVEMNNVNMLIRVRSRMVSSVWLVCVSTIPVLHTYSPSLVAVLCLSVAYYQLFSTYQRRGCEVSTFHYALMIGLGSIFVPHMVCFLPIFLWHQTFFLRSTTLRTFFAALIGCSLPLAAWGAYWVVVDDYAAIQQWLAVLTTYTYLDVNSYLSLSISQIASWGFISFLGLVGMWHYLATSYNDKIQTRMLLYAFVCQFVLIEAFIGAQPQHLDEWMPMLLVTSSPLIAHFFALTSSWFTNALFVLSFLGFCALGYLNLFWFV